MIAHDVAEIVSDVLAGRILDRAAFAARVSALAGSLSTTQSEALHLAGHFLDDDDIRRTDVEYDRDQRHELQEEFRRLKSTATPAV